MFVGLIKTTLLFDLLPRLGRDLDNVFCWDSKKGEIGSRSDLAFTASRLRALLAAKPKHHAAGVSNVILVIAEAFRGSAQAGAVELRHHVLNLDRLDRDVLSPVEVQTAAGRGREMHPVSAADRWDRSTRARHRTGTGGMASSAQNGRRLKRGPDEQIRQGLVIDPRPRICVAAEIGD